MFNKKNENSNYTDALGKTNRIVEGTVIKGDIISPADFRLDGRLEGNFKSLGKLVIGPAGSINGTIHAVNADIEGNFEGKIHIEDLLTLKATSKVNGEISCGKLAVEPGADFSSTCVMKSNSKNSEPQLIEEKKK